MNWNETIQELLESRSISYAEMMTPKFTIAHKFDDDECYQLWTMRFDSAQEAKDWIKQNHPESYRTQQWVVVQFPDGVMM